MRKILPFIIGMFAVSASQAQESTSSPVPFFLKVSSQDTGKLPLSQYLERNRLPKTGMPNKYNVKSPPPVFYHNNGKGFDVFGSTLDNMPLLMPDSDYVTGMPVLKPKSESDSLQLNGSGLPDKRYWQKSYPNLKPDTARLGKQPYPPDFKKKNNKEY